MYYFCSLHNENLSYWIICYMHHVRTNHKSNSTTPKQFYTVVCFCFFMHLSFVLKYDSNVLWLRFLLYTALAMRVALGDSLFKHSSMCWFKMRLFMETCTPQIGQTTSDLVTWDGLLVSQETWCWISSEQVVDLLVTFAGLKKDLRVSWLLPIHLEVWRAVTFTPV